MEKAAHLHATFARPIAHRGFHEALATTPHGNATARGLIENTRSAFEAAITRGYGMECDVQMSSDGEAMVFHDFTLDRLTEGQGRVDALPARKLATLPFKQTADRMEPLTALLAQVAGRAPLCIEVKSRHDGDTRLAARVAEVVRGYAGPLVLKSFDPLMLLALREAGVAYPLGIVAMQDYSYPDYAALDAADKHALANLLHFAETKPDFLSWRHADLPSAAPYLCRIALGLPVMAWTIRSAADAARANPHIDQMVFEGFVAER
jgi:glycerophosphoryl diester phosphodiesterase